MSARTLVLFLLGNRRAILDAASSRALPPIGGLRAIRRSCVNDRG